MEKSMLEKSVEPRLENRNKRTGIIGWGYEGKSIDDLLDDCHAWGVGTVVDVRLNPWSHKRDFTKAKLNIRLEHEGLKYIHLKALGNPKDNRAGFVSPSSEERLESILRFEREMDNDESINALRYLNMLSRNEYVLLLCFEKNESQCHRSVIKTLIRQINS